MTNLELFGILLLPNIDGYVYFLPAIAILLVLSAFTLLKPGIVNPTAIAVMAAQVMILFGFVGKNEMVVHTGSEITLAVHSYDPYDIFRGNYLSFQFDISNLSCDKVKFVSAESFKRDDTVFVVLEKTTKLWEPVALYDRMPAVESNQVALRGRVTYSFGKNVNVHYGLEQYFYPDGKQMHINKDAFAKIKVDRNGDAVLTELVP